MTLYPIYTGRRALLTHRSRQQVRDYNGRRVPGVDGVQGHRHLAPARRLHPASDQQCADVQQVQRHIGAAGQPPHSSQQPHGHQLCARQQCALTVRVRTAHQRLGAGPGRLHCHRVAEFHAQGARVEAHPRDAGGTRWLLVAGAFVYESHVSVLLLTCKCPPPHMQRAFVYEFSFPCPRVSPHM